MHSPSEERKILVMLFVGVTALFSLVVLVSYDSVMISAFAQSISTPKRNSSEPVAPVQASPSAIAAPIAAPIGAPVVQQVALARQQARQSEIYRCEVAGHVFYSDKGCPSSRKQQVDVALNGAPNPPVQDANGGREPARGAAQIAPADPVAERTAKVAACKRLEDAILASEVDARAPRPASYQDALSRQQRVLQKQKSDLAC